MWGLNTSYPNPIVQLQDNVAAEMIESLKLALEVYRLDGTTNSDNMSVKILFNF